VRDKKDVLPAIERVGGAPVIIKLLEGTQGIGVILADSSKIAEAIIETLHSTRENVLVQHFVSESKGRDIRAIVVGDQRGGRHAAHRPGHEFRSNVHRGGKAELLELPRSSPRRPSAPRRSWGCGWPASTCSRARTGRRSSR
jgi:ribosomal protein S6--L-glutamate ligase